MTLCSRAKIEQLFLTIPDGQREVMSMYYDTTVVIKPVVLERPENRDIFAYRTRNSIHNDKIRAKRQLISSDLLKTVVRV